MTDAAQGEPIPADAMVDETLAMLFASAYIRLDGPIGVLDIARQAQTAGFDEIVIEKSRRYAQDELVNGNGIDGGSIDVE